MMGLGFLHLHFLSRRYMAYFNHQMLYPCFGISVFLSNNIKVLCHSTIQQVRNSAPRSRTLKPPDLGSRSVALLVLGSNAEDDGGLSVSVDVSRG